MYYWDIGEKGFGSYYPPDSAARQCKKHHTNSRISFEFIYDGLSFLLRHLAIKANAAKGGLVQTGLDNVES